MKKIVFLVLVLVFLPTAVIVRFVSPVVSYPPETGFLAEIDLPVHNIDSGKNFSTIQEAINDNETLDGHTIFVEEGTYYENVVINKSISLIGMNRNTTIIDGNKTGNVVRVVTSDVYVRNFTIRNSRPPPPSPWWARGDSGIYLGGYSHNITIRDNMITDCYWGIEIVISHNNIIENNNLWNNRSIRLHSTTDNSINNNAISGTAIDFGPGIYLDFGANRNKIINNTITNTGSGIDINFDCANNTLRDNTISKCTFGIISYSCYNNSVTRNVVSNCISGISLSGSRNVISKNNVSYCEYGGVDVTLSNFTVVSGNLLTHNGVGIIIASSHSTIFGNTLIHNNHGLDLGHCTNNTFYHNNFVNNTIQVYSNVDTINEWDNGYPSGGNYWSDYNGTDANQDGIGDTPYVIDANNQDNFPLMGMFYDFPVTYQEEIYPVTIICNSTISEFQFTNNLTTIINDVPGTWLVNVIVFNVSGEDGTLGFCRICIPMALMNEPYEVFVKGTWVPYTLLPCSNSTHNYLYFTYNHSTQEVVIIPEFPTWTQMLLLFVVLTVAIAIYKRRLSGT